MTTEEKQELVKRIDAMLFMEPTRCKSTHSFPKLITMQGVGYPHPVILRFDESRDGPVKVAEVKHTASYDAKELANEIRLRWNNHEALVSALELARINMIDAQAHGIGMGGAIEKAEQALTNAREKG